MSSRQDVRSPSTTNHKISAADLVPPPISLGAISSPISRLPLETLVLVFSHCSPNDWKKIHRNRTDVILPSHVCRYWRNVALSTPTLWSRNSVKLRPGDVVNFRRIMDITRTWLERSAQCPLSLSFTIPDTDLDFAPLMELVLHHCKRWRDLRLSIPPSMFNVLASAKGELPLLKKLVLRGTPATYSLDGVRADFFQSAPWLRSISWGLYFSDINQFKFSWTQVKEVNIRTDNFQIALQIARGCPKLTLLELRTTIPEDDLPVSPLRQTNLPRLTCLRLTCFSDPGPFFAALTLPALRSLDIDYNDFKDETHEEISRLLDRSHCPLTMWNHE